MQKTIEITNSLNTMLAMKRLGIEHERLGVDPEKCWRKMDDHRYRDAITRPKFWRPGMVREAYLLHGETPVSILAHTLDMTPMIEMLPETKANVQWWLRLALRDKVETKSLYDHLSEEETALFYDLPPRLGGNFTLRSIKMVTAIRR
ncbi:hypothetical protein SPFM15_00082 [Salmonella phage SPFM15]|nr:hypothetical protein SPFM5_00077 [Salmonella phage SPFM5]VFR13706.1 hypothetical protein SPFM15_00082 [Salmonella phage SPFM15]